jgi:hypothetical protein
MLGSSKRMLRSSKRMLRSSKYEDVKIDGFTFFPFTLFVNQKSEKPWKITSSLLELRKIRFEKFENSF